MAALIRPMTEADLAETLALRLAVRENPLPPGQRHLIRPERVRAVLAEGGSFVAEAAGRIQGFAMASGGAPLDCEPTLWALFVRGEAEGRGLGKALLAAAVAWLSAQGHREAWLSTDSGTRAEGFYLCQGWQPDGSTPEGERRFRLGL
jgi:GNAT superfamily N-acetyltransferase